MRYSHHATTPNRPLVPPHQLIEAAAAAMPIFANDRVYERAVDLRDALAQAEHLLPTMFLPSTWDARRLSGVLASAWKVTSLAHEQPHHSESDLVLLKRVHPRLSTFRQALEAISPGEYQYGGAPRSEVQR